MKVAIDLSATVYGTGVADYLVNLFAHLTKIDQTITYLPFAGTLRRQHSFKSLYPDIKTIPISPVLQEILWNRLRIAKLENFLGKFDIYHSSDWAQAPTSAKKVTTIHDLSPLIYPHEHESGILRNITRVHQRRLKLVAEECNAIICVSENTARDVQELLGVSSRKITVIPEALPQRFDIDPSPEETRSCMAKHSLIGCNYTLTIGTLNPRKNLQSLIDSFVNYHSKYSLPDKLVVVGNLGWGNALTRHTSIVSTGYLPDRELVALLRGAESFVLPSLYEGFGLPILLAFRHGIPVAASDRSSLPEVVGESGVLFNPLDPEAIAHGIHLSIVNKKSLVRSGAKQLQKFSWTKSAKQTIEIYKSLCS